MILHFMDNRYWNSVRFAYPVWGDKLMPVSLLFARNKNRGANFVFNKDSITATYFSNIKNNQESTLKINFTKDKNDNKTTIIKFNWTNWSPQKTLIRSKKEKLN